MSAKNIIELTPPQNVSMGDEWFNIVSPNHFWIIWRFLVIKRLFPLKKRSDLKVMEIGAGSGVFREQFESSFNIPLDGCDLNLPALQRADKGLGQLYIYDIFTKKEEMKEKYDLIFLLDVIEHIEDDSEFIKTACHMLKPGGKVIINVPYGQWLYSNYDRAVGHIRRYSTSSLKSCIQRSELDLCKIKSWGFLLVPIAALRKLLMFFHKSESGNQNTIEAGMKTPNPLVDFALSSLMRIETFLPLMFPLGTSILAIAEKKVSND